MNREHQRPAWEDKAAALPSAAGVYLFKDADGQALYVGKAKNLKSRVRAYTREGGDERYHVQFLRPKIADLDYIVTDTEGEAIILENNLIKKHRPRYNLRLRDDKTFYHLRLTRSEEFPRLQLTRRPQKRGPDLLFGPFASSTAVRETIRLVQEIFPLRRCRSPRLQRRERPCLNQQIGKCAGPCAGRISREDYARLVDQVMKFLKGRKPELVEELKSQMRSAALALEFERAADLRDRIAAVERTLERQKVDSVRPLDRDVFGLFREGSRVSVSRLIYREGVLLESAAPSFARVSLPDDEVLSSVISQTYLEREKPPPEILVPFPPLDQDLLEPALSRALGKGVHIWTPERGEPRQLVMMAMKNAEQALRREPGRGEDREGALAELQRRLRLERLPRWIECVDISNIGGEHAVGSIVSFKEGEPDQGGYRRFRIKGVEGANDYEMMREVLDRRFGRALREGKPLPDLLVVDGGKGQLNAARAALRELGIGELELAGLAKDREQGDPRSDQLQKKGERIYLPGVKEPVRLKPGTHGLVLVQRVRDEAHRFAIAYHQKLRGHKIQRSSLEAVPGIGSKKAASLLKHFRGLDRLRAATLEELASAPGISKADAERIRRHFDERGEAEE